MVISLVSILSVTYITKTKGIDLPLIIYAGPFPIWLVFFVMGCYLRKVKRKYSLCLPMNMVLLGIVFSYAETYYWNVNYGGGFGIKFSSFVYSMAVIMLLFSSRIECAYKHNVINKIIEYIGRVSFAIYLYHMFILYVLSIFHILEGLPWIVRWLICLTVTFVVIVFIKRILPSKYHWYFGA